MGLFDLFGKNKKNDVEMSQSNQEEQYDKEVGLYFISDDGKARYTVEHVLFKKIFFKNPKECINALRQSNELIYNIFVQFMGDSNISKSDFMVSSSDNNQLEIIEISLPEPKYQCLCKRIYLVDDHMGQYGYFTVERGTTGLFFCRWDGDKHLNYGTKEDDNWRGSQKEYELFKIFTICMGEMRKKDIDTSGFPGDEII